MIKLVSDTIDKNDINHLIEWLSQDEIPRLTKGELTVELEKKWAQKMFVLDEGYPELHMLNLFLKETAP